jgi:hypothetical protein
MFKWDETLAKLNVPASRALKLYRSMRDVQLALPGLPSQEASAYLCQYQVGKTVATVAVFHLHGSRQLAFYCSDPREVSPQKSENLLEQGLNFVESMGFLLSDMDIDLLDGSDREKLWESLPLQSGIVPVDQAPIPMEKKTPEPVVAQPAVEKKVSRPGVATDVGAAAKTPPAEAPAPQGKKAVQHSPEEGPERVVQAPNDQKATGDVDDLLAAVEGLRARRPGLAAVKKQLSPEEVSKRCQSLKKNLGRILASL